MAYVVRDSNNNIVATVADNTVDNTTTIQLIGKNYVGYGAALNQNLVRMLEHFAKTSSPNNPITGQIWFDTTTSDLKVYNGSSFVHAIKTVANLSGGNLSASGTITATGNVSGSQLLSTVADGTPPIVIASSSRVANLNAAVAGTLLNGNSNVSIAANSFVTVSVSGTANVVNVAATGVSITGDANISGNINSGLLQNGNSNVTITANSAVSVAANGAVRMTVAANGNIGIGTASPARMLHVNGDTVLGGSPAAQYSNVTISGSAGIQSSAPLLNFVDAAGSTRFGYLYHTGTAGTLYLLNQEAGAVRFGTNNTERMRIDSSGNMGIGTSSPSAPGGTINLVTASSGTTIIKSQTSSTTTGVARFDLATGTSNSYTLFALQDNTAAPYFQLSSGNGVLNHYYDGPNHIFRNIAGTERMRIDSSGNVGIGTATTSAAMLTVAGNVLPSANLTYNLGATGSRWSNIWGVSSSALYADLAEKYRSDADYVPGTVLELGGAHEITVCNTPRSDRVFGCVSTDPAYLMNDNSKEGIWLPVVLVGRAPIRVAGPVSKGDRLVSAGNGAAMAAGAAGSSYQTEIGRALETKTTADVGLIQAYINTK
jgi:hypothetical protein